ncbi:MAG: gamma-glutamyltransferase, partial [Paracoccaceae bacterium]
MTDLHRTPYLEQRAEKYYFRRRLPFDSNSKSNRFFVFSLRTDIASEARDISGRLTAMTTLAYDYARGCPTMDQNTFKALLSELVRVEIAAFEKTRLSTGQRSLAAAEFAAQREDAIQTTWSAARTEGGDRRAGLAATRAAFYTGPIAQRIVDFHADKGGLLRAEDLASYEVREEPT